MIVQRFTPLNYFEIWSRRFHDNKVLLAAHKVGTHNKVVFTKDPTLGTHPYYVAGTTVKKYKKESNGAIPVYAVPIDEFEPLEIDTRDLREIL